MNDDLTERVAAQLRLASADTEDCPTLFHRVAAGVERRRRRHRVAAAGLVAVVLAVGAPAVTVGLGGIGPQLDAGSANASCAGLTSTECSHLLSARAQLALQRANPPEAATAAAGPAIVARVVPDSTCQRRPYCPV